MQECIPKNALFWSTLTDQVPNGYAFWEVIIAGGMVGSHAHELKDYFLVLPRSADGVKCPAADIYPVAREESGRADLCLDWTV